MYIFSVQGQLMTVDGNTASQSSMKTAGWSEPYRAIDGVLDTDFYNIEHCAHTDNFTENWWQVKLAPAGPVTRVDIYFRSDCCST